MNKNLSASIEHLKGKKKVVFITTSNRSEWVHEIPKSTQLAHHIAKEIGEEKVTFFDIAQMNIVPCLGHVSNMKINDCGVKEALLKDQEKNPSGCNRCRASFEKGDELWKISKALLESEVIMFFTSVRRGQANSMYQKLIERFTWIENRHSTLGEENIIKDIEAGIIVIGHNWNNETVLNTQKEVLKMYGFKVPKQLSRGRTFTNMNDESQESYQKAVEQFEKDFGFELKK